jgi:hypothetical protein
MMSHRSAYQHIDGDAGGDGHDAASLELLPWRHGIAHQARDDHSTASDTVHLDTPQEADREGWPMMKALRHESEARPDVHRVYTEGWTPFYLHRSTIVFFILVEILMLVGLVILYQLDLKNNGLATTDSSKHYFWTYGPTAGQYLPYGSKLTPD